MDDVLNIIIWLAILQGVLLGVLFLSSKKYNSFSNKLLGGFLLALMVEAIVIFIPFGSIFGYSINHYFEVPETKILFPLFFLHYVLEKIGKSDHFKNYLRFNYGIALIVVLFTLINMSIFIFSGNTIYDFFSFDFIENIFLGQQTYAFLLSFSGITIAIIETNEYKKIVSNNYSDFDLLEISWLWRFIALLVPATLLWGAELTRIFIGFYQGHLTSWNFVEATWAVLIVFIYFVSYQAFKHQDFFAKVNINLEVLITKGDETISSRELEEHLLNSMTSAKLFLQSDLSIYEVAKQIDSSTRKVSNCINENFGYNFSEWVNRFRVDEVKMRFEERSSNYLTIEAIGQESGFKSRSAMYSAFSKFTGQSPAKFRKTDLS